LQVRAYLQWRADFTGLTAEAVAREAATGKARLLRERDVVRVCRLPASPAHCAERSPQLGRPTVVVKVALNKVDERVLAVRARRGLCLLLSLRGVCRTRSGSASFLWTRRWSKCSRKAARKPYSRCLTCAASSAPLRGTACAFSYADALLPRSTKNADLPFIRFFIKCAARFDATRDAHKLSLHRSQADV